ncbi:MAG: O-antigen ligase family protein [Alphaproteobacteria bacterium]|nr:O-antigen ligase family protein [Alphaproteobacteria bacterium]
MMRSVARGMSCNAGGAQYAPVRFTRGAAIDITGFAAIGVRVPCMGSVPLSRIDSERNVGLSASLNSFFWRYIHGSHEGASRRWGKAIFVLFLLFPGIGSGGSVWLEGMWFVALLHWFFDPGSRRMTRDELKLVGVFAAYVLIMGAFAFTHAAIQGGNSGLSVFLTNSPFLLVAPLLPVLRRAARPGWSALFFAGAACGPILAALIVTIASPYSWELHRAGLSGNPLILALGGLVTGLLCLHGALFFRGWMRWLLMAGALAAVYVMLTSGSRGPLLSFGIVTLLYALIMGYRHFGLGKMLGRLVVLIVVLAGIVTVFSRYDPYIAKRIDFIVERVSNPVGGGVAESSILTRLVLYEGGLRAFLDNPLTGHGRQNVLAAVKAQSDEVAERFFGYTHLHNGYLTDLVASGVLGLLSLIAVLAMPLIVFWNTRPLVFGSVLCLVLAYGFYGMTNLLFYHDVATLLFLGVVVVCNALAGVGEVEPDRLSD